MPLRLDLIRYSLGIEIVLLSCSCIRNDSTMPGLDTTVPLESIYIYPSNFDGKRVSTHGFVQQDDTGEIYITNDRYIRCGDIGVEVDNIVIISLDQRDAKRIFRTPVRPGENEVIISGVFFNKHREGVDFNVDYSTKGEIVMRRSPEKGPGPLTRLRLVKVQKLEPACSNTSQDVPGD